MPHSAGCEDLEAQSAAWTLQQYGSVVYQFGVFGGAYLAGRSLPHEPWLSQDLIRAWVANSAYLIELAHSPDAWQHPMLQRLFPSATIAAVLQLWETREALLAELARLPRTLCQHDLWRNNLLVRSGAGGQHEIVVIDWELVGYGASGEDVGNLLGVSLLNFDVPAAQATALGETILANYTDGLHAAGWSGNPQTVEYAYNTAAALRCVFSTALWPAAIMRRPERYVAETEQRWQRSIESIFEHWATITTFLLDRAYAAQAFLSR